MFCVSVWHSNIVYFFTGKSQFWTLERGVSWQNERCVSKVFERERDSERL